METGQLRHRVTIQAADTPVVRNAAGEQLPTFSTVATVWAAIQPAGGRELYAGERLQAELTHKITIRYYDGLTTDHRLSFGGRIFDINAVRNIDEMGIWHELLCKELAT